MYWAGPISGAVSAAFIYEFVFSSNASRHKLKHFLTDVNYTGDYLYEGVKLKDPCQCGDEAENERGGSTDSEPEGVKFTSLS